MRSLQPWAITMAYNSGEADRLLPFEEPGSTSRKSPQSQEFAVDLRTVHEVRIHLPPPDSLNCRETPLRCSLNWRETRSRSVRAGRSDQYGGQWQRFRRRNEWLRQRGIQWPAGPLQRINRRRPGD